MISTYEKETLKLLGKHIGFKNPISGREISSLINLKTKGVEGAEMRNIIHQLRLKNYPICATFNGYYYAMTIEELENFRKILKNRIREQYQIWKILGSLETIKKVGKNPDLPSEEDELKELSLICS